MRCLKDSVSLVSFLGMFGSLLPSRHGFSLLGSTLSQGLGFFDTMKDDSSGVFLGYMPMAYFI